MGDCALRAGRLPGRSLEDGVFVGPAVVFTNDDYPRAITPEDKPKRGADRRYLRSRRVITYQFRDLDGWRSCASSACGRLGITRYQERRDRSRRRGRRRHGGGTPRQVLPAWAVTDFDLASATKVAPQHVVGLVSSADGDDQYQQNVLVDLVADTRHRSRTTEKSRPGWCAVSASRWPACRKDGCNERINRNGDP
jgi:hypothetical protein